jgi:D-ribose pyranose/furanose isomerase RbsD
MSKDTRTIVIDSISRLEQALLDGKLVSTLSSHKTVGVVFQLRVPRKMRAGEIKAYVNTALTAGVERPEDFGKDISVYKQRVEVFMP